LLHKVRASRRSRPGFAGDAGVGDHK